MYKECDTEEHEVRVLSNQSATVGVSLFLSDREVGGVLLGQILRLLFTSHHQGGYPGQELCEPGPKSGPWPRVSINILSQDEAVVRNISIKHSKLWR